MFRSNLLTLGVILSAFVQCQLEAGPVSWKDQRVAGYRYVRGRVVDSNGQPARGVDVGLHWKSCQGKLAPLVLVMTDDQGRFEIPWIPSQRATAVMAMDSLRETGGLALIPGVPNANQNNNAADREIAETEDIELSITLAPLVNVRGSYFNDQVKRRPASVWTSVVLGPDDTQVIENDDRVPYFSFRLPAGSYLLRGNTAHFSDLYRELELDPAKQTSHDLPDLPINPENSDLAQFQTDDAPPQPETGALKSSLIEGIPIGQRHVAFNGHTDMAFAVEFLPDAKQLITAASDNTIRFWDLETRKQTRLIRCTAKGKSLSSYGLSPLFVAKQGELVGGYYYFIEDKRVQYCPRFWHADSNFRRATILNDPMVSFGRATISPDGRLFASYIYKADEKAELVRIYDVTTGSQITELDVHGERKRDAGVGSTAKFSPNSQYLAVAGDKGATLQVWDVDQSKRLWEHRPENTYGVNSISFSPDGETVACATWNEPIEIRSTVSGELKRTLRLPSHRATVVSYSKSGRYIATVGNHPLLRICIWDVSTGKPVGLLTGHPTGARAEGLDWSPDDRFLATAAGVTTNAPGEVLLWDLHENRII